MNYCWNSAKDKKLGWLGWPEVPNRGQFPNFQANSSQCRLKSSVTQKKSCTNLCRGFQFKRLWWEGIVGGWQIIIETSTFHIRHTTWFSWVSHQTLGQLITYVSIKQIFLFLPRVALHRVIALYPWFPRATSPHEISCLADVWREDYPLKGGKGWGCSDLFKMRRISGYYQALST